MTEYFFSDVDPFITSRELGELDPDAQRDVMEHWFRARFEDPAERTPFESAEGGHIWIWGGPYDARDELLAEFGRVVGDGVIEDLAESLTEECSAWTRTPSADEFDAYIAEDISGITEYYHHFTGALLDIERLLESSVDPSCANLLWRLLYVNVVTALETYLSDAFINTVVNDPTLLQRFVESNPEFQNTKVPLSQVLRAAGEMNRRVRTYLVDMVWHSLARVKEMYRQTLGITFPDAGPVFRAILVRHDIVHRNGRTKTGDEIVIMPEDVRALISDVESLAQEIDLQIYQSKLESLGDEDGPADEG